MRFTGIVTLRNERGGHGERTGVVMTGDGDEDGGVRGSGSVQGCGRSGRSAYVSSAGLRRRGWTPGIVRGLLGAPDAWGWNPCGRAVPPTRLYRVARVRAVERSEGFGRARWAGDAHGDADRRRAAVLAIIRVMPVAVPRLTLHDLAERAFRHRDVLDGHGPARCHGESVPDPVGLRRAAPADLDRWMVGYLRQALVRHDDLLDGIHDSPCRAEAERLLRERVYEGIAEAYPRLADECRRQLDS